MSRFTYGKSSSGVSGEIRVLHCAETIKGGIATYLNSLAPIQESDDSFSEVHILVPKSQEDSLIIANRSLISTFRDGPSRVFNSLILAAAVLRLLRSKNFNIIHIHSTFAGLVIRPLIFILPFYSIKVIYCSHGWAWDRDLPIFYKKMVVLIEKALTFFTHMTVCISHYEYLSALKNGFPSSKLALIRNGIKIDHPLPGEGHISFATFWPDNILKLLFVGRLDHQKGFDVLHSAVSVLGDSVFLKVAGQIVSGDYECPQKTLKNVEYLGWQSGNNLTQLYLSADVLIIPSRWEGFGLVALEAMKHKLPIIASRVGGLQELIDDGSTGILIEPNSVTTLISAIGEISAKDIKLMGKAGYQKLIEEFSIDRVHSELSFLYRGVLGLNLSSI